ncbi:choice-of-anchor A family protein, partial [uncultured Bifidobacterium sp.]|uniref:choice-of-anchor A family protein n=1 Tax=uncultured Bifidobacterium sp. TaxID=165187 RepID=UPI0026219C66
MGGNMYIGDPSSNWGSDSPTGSYAAEAEGLTVVKNNFYANLLKGFFTMGTVAFGANYRPADGSMVLSVGGNAQTWNGVKVQGVGISGNGDYQGQIGGDGPTRVWGQDASTSTQSASVYRYDYGTEYPQEKVYWGSSAAQSLSVNGTDYSTYGITISTLSSQLDALSTTGTTTLGTAPADSTYAKYKYDGKVKASFAIAAGAEKLITFAGNDSSKLQVFQVKASDLASHAPSTGLDFAFTGIPDGASVIVNVVNGDGTPYKGTVDFQQGWRFWWNGAEISNGYVEAGATDAVTDAMRSAYTAASQSIMWNYSGATSVDIKGSQATKISGSVDKASSSDPGWSQFSDATVTDDPSSAVLGSILVPGGNLTTHVTTNGRVWVGGNYAMLNTSNVKQGSEDIVFGTSKSASIVDMDQERHNLPWSASLTSSCSTIS